MKQIDAEKTTVRFTLPILAGLLGFLGSFATGITVWGLTTQADAKEARNIAQTLKVETEAKLSTMDQKLTDVRESQIRMEVKLGLPPSYKSK